jgi:hypothetical protein
MHAVVRGTVLLGQHDDLPAGPVGGGGVDQRTALGQGFQEAVSHHSVADQHKGLHHGGTLRRRSIGVLCLRR